MAIGKTQALEGDVGALRAQAEASPGTRTGKGCRASKVYIVNRAGEIAARTFTDAVGRFTPRRAPAGTYELRFVGPWRYAHRSAQFWNIVAGQTRSIDLQVLPGPSQPDPDAPPPSTSDEPPRPQARAAGSPTPGPVFAS